jgi:type VI protein secretion system component VasK
VTIPEKTVAVWLAVLGSVISWLFGRLLPRPKWPPEVWAAWVQAVGSVGAIVAAFMVARCQEQLAAKERHRTAIAEQERVLQACQHAGAELRVTLERLHEEAKRRRGEEAKRRRGRSFHTRARTSTSRSLSSTRRTERCRPNATAC